MTYYYQLLPGGPTNFLAQKDCFSTMKQAVGIGQCFNMTPIFGTIPTQGMLTSVETSSLTTFTYSLFLNTDPWFGKLYGGVASCTVGIMNQNGVNVQTCPASTASITRPYTSATGRLTPIILSRTLQTIHLRYWYAHSYHTLCTLQKKRYIYMNI